MPARLFLVKSKVPGTAGQSQGPGGRHLCKRCSTCEESCFGTRLPSNLRLHIQARSSLEVLEVEERTDALVFVGDEEA